MKIELEQVEPAEIESRSMEIIESELPHEIDPKLAPIIKRAVHTAADFDYVDNLCFSEDVVDKALEAIKNGANRESTELRSIDSTETTKLNLYLPTLGKIIHSIYCEDPRNRIMLNLS